MFYYHKYSSEKSVGEKLGVIVFRAVIIYILLFCSPFIIGIYALYCVVYQYYKLIYIYNNLPGKYFSYTHGF